MKFNGDVLAFVNVTDKQHGEPDQYAIVRNLKAAGGVIPYARYGENWVANPVPTRPLIRALVMAALKIEHLSKWQPTKVEKE